MLLLFLRDSEELGNVVTDDINHFLLIHTWSYPLHFPYRRSENYVYVFAYVIYSIYAY